MRGSEHHKQKVMLLCLIELLVQVGRCCRSDANIGRSGVDLCPEGVSDRGHGNESLVLLASPARNSESKQPIRRFACVDGTEFVKSDGWPIGNDQPIGRKPDSHYTLLWVLGEGGDPHPIAV